MRFLKQGFRAICAAVILSSFAAGGITAVTTTSIANSAKDVRVVMVNRINKGDRLPRAIAPRHHSNSNNSPVETKKRVPLGCDPAFSPIVDPASAHFFNRCIV
jgi:hypothetical protein